MAGNAQPRNARESEDRERALAALALMRREKLSLRAAARAWETDPKTVRRFVGSAIRKDGRGRYQARAFDRIPRTLNFPTENGTIPLTVRDSRTASRIGKYLNAVRNRSGDTSSLHPFKNKSFRVSGVVYRFVTDPDSLERLWLSGSLGAIESLYYAHLGS
jgi:hypothetical protein